MERIRRPSAVGDQMHHTLIEGIRTRLQHIAWGDISPSAYDTAWLGRIESDTHPNQPMFAECVDWVLDNQLDDGSWGSPNLVYYHDRILSTLSCLTTLRRWSVGEQAVQRGETYLRDNLPNLAKDPYATVGFELIFPVLLMVAEMLDLDLPYDSPIVETITQQRDDKLQRLPLHIIHRMPTTALHSLEGLAGVIDFDAILKLQAANGSFLNSPSSTAFVYMNTQNPQALAYLKDVLKQFGGAAPVNYPLDVFERLWVLHDLDYLGLKHYFSAEIADLLDYTAQQWTSVGMPWSYAVQTPDIDDTSVGFRMLRQAGYPVDVRVFDAFSNGDSFFCFPGERDSSVSHLMNLFLTAQLRHPDDKILAHAEQYCRRYFANLLESGKPIGDKWVIRQDMDAYLQATVTEDPFRSAPVVQQDVHIRHYQRSMMDAHWLDKTVYYMENIHHPDLLELAQVNQQIIKANVQTEHQILQGWAQSHPSLNPVMLLPNAFIAANLFADPDQSDARLLFSKVSMQLFGADAIYDGEDFSRQDMQIMFEALATLSAAPLARLHDPYKRDRVADLLDIMDEVIAEASRLQGFDVSGLLRAVWRENIAANRAETMVKLDQQIPSLKDYFQITDTSTGAPITLAVCFAALAPLTDAFVQSDHFAYLLQTAGRLTRISNDLRSYARELQEGKVNSVGILMEQGMTQAQAEAHLNAMFDATMRDLLAGMASAGQHQVFYQFTYDVCRTAAWFYTDNDFGDYTRAFVAQTR